MSTVNRNIVLKFIFYGCFVLSADNEEKRRFAKPRFNGNDKPFVYCVIAGDDPSPLV